MSKSDYGSMNDPRCIEAINLVKGHIDKHLVDAKGALTVEFRLGYFEDAGFNGNIGHVYFDKIRQVLSASKVWTRVLSTETEEFMHKDYRLSVFPDGTETAVKKERLGSVNFEISGSSYDMMVLLAKETPVPQSKVQKKKARATNVFSVHRKLSSFVFGDSVSFNLSEVRAEDNGVTDFIYELELVVTPKGLEMLKNKTITSHYLVHDVLLKVLDLVSIVEPLDENPRFTPITV